MKLNSMMKLSVVLLVMVLLAGCTRVGPGHVGIKVDYAGSNKGVEDAPVQTGWIFYSPFSSTVIEYPTYVQTAVWSRSSDEGSSKNEELTFNSKEGTIITADISLSYQILDSKVPRFYVKYRKDELDGFTHGIVRNTARDSFGEEAVKYTVEELNAAKKEEFLQAVRARVNKQFEDVGFHVEQFGFVGNIRVPDQVQQAMTNKVTAIQEAQRAENQLRQTQAEMMKVRAQAEGEALAQVARAKGEAEANRIRNSAITPALLEMRRLDNANSAIFKWNGALPHFMGGQQPVPFLDVK